MGCPQVNTRQILSDGVSAAAVSPGDICLHFCQMNHIHSGDAEIVYQILGSGPPVVLLHPETGRKALYVTQSCTTRIVELSPAESRHLLNLLFEHIKSPDFSMRWRWTPNDVAMWDNRSVQHYAVPDYDTERVVHRIIVAGERPCGPPEADA